MRFKTFSVKRYVLTSLVTLEMCALGVCALTYIWRPCICAVNFEQSHLKSLNVSLILHCTRRETCAALAFSKQILCKTNLHFPYVTFRLADLAIIQDGRPYISKSKHTRHLFSWKQNVYCRRKIAFTSLYPTKSYNV